MNRQSLYTKECGSYYYKDFNGNIIFMTDEVSLLYDSFEGILLKHGSPDQVSKHYENYKKMDELGTGLQFDFRLVTSSKWKVSELNRILDTSGYIKLLDTDPNRFEEDINTKK